MAFYPRVTKIMKNALLYLDCYLIHPPLILVPLDIIVNLSNWSASDLDFISVEGTI